MKNTSDQGCPKPEKSHPGPVWMPDFFGFGSRFLGLGSSRETLFGFPISIICIKQNNIAIPNTFRNQNNISPTGLFAKNGNEKYNFQMYN